MKKGLALGGGGIKGIAHLGALAVLEEKGFRPDVVAGCSIGALIGVFVAAQIPIADVRALFDHQQTRKLLSARFDGMGLWDVEGLRKFLTDHLPRRLEDLPTPMHIVCTDLASGTAVTCTHGSLADAVLASTCIPGLFAPVQIEGKWLVDGGLTDHLPLRLLHEAGVDYTVAIRLYNLEADWALVSPPNEPDPNEKASLLDSVKTWLSGLTPQAVRVLERSFEIIMAQNEAVHLAQFPPDVLIEPLLTDVLSISFNADREPIYARGHDAARQALQNVSAENWA